MRILITISTGFDPVYRRFESYHPSQFLKLSLMVL
jgi:hypothetical protein